MLRAQTNLVERDKDAGTATPREYGYWRLPKRMQTSRSQTDSSSTASLVGTRKKSTNFRVHSHRREVRLPGCAAERGP